MFARTCPARRRAAPGHAKTSLLETLLWIMIGEKASDLIRAA